MAEEQAEATDAGAPCVIIKAREGKPPLINGNTGNLAGDLTLYLLGGIQLCEDMRALKDFPELVDVHAALLVASLKVDAMARRLQPKIVPPPLPSIINGRR